MGYRVQGILVRARPDGAGLTALERAYGYRLYELIGQGLWLIDLGIPEPKPGDRILIRAAKTLAPSYVDALRVLGSDDEKFEQLAWLTAAAAAARQLRQPVVAFLSDDDLLDFAAMVSPDGVSCIADRSEPYLLRWEAGALAIQPYSGGDPGKEPPTPPEELELIPAVTLMPIEQLPGGGYPLHGNANAEVHDFAPNASSLRIGTWEFGPPGSLRLIEAHGLDHGPWDRAAGGATVRGR